MNNAVLMEIESLRRTTPAGLRRKYQELPPERRYVWRIASSLKWGFADFDNVTVDIDKQTLSDEDFARVRELLKLRPMQFCMFLKALFGEEEMERMMVHAITVAKREE